MLLALMLLAVLTVPALAEPSPDLLADPDFEEQDDASWVPYVRALLEFSEEGALSGKTCLHVSERSHQTDVVCQIVTDQMNYYGPGTYKFYANVRLLDPEIEGLQMQLAVGYYGAEGKRWATTPFKTVTADGWTKLSTTQTIKWEGELDQVEFYIVTNEEGLGLEEYPEILIDDCSLVKTKFEGTDFWDLTPEPTKEPTAAPTQAPTAVPQATAAPEATAQPEKTETNSQKTVGFVLIGGGAVVFIASLVLLITAKKGKKDEK